MWHDKKEYFRQSDGEFPGYRRGTGLIPRIVFLLFLFLALAVGESGQALSDGTVSLTLQERQWLSQHDGQVRIGITVIPPQIIRDNVGYQGLSIDYIRLMERKLGCRFKLVPFATWNEVIQAAKMRRIDMIFAAQKTPDRLAYLLFTEPYIELPNMIVVRKDRQGGATLKEMKGWSVATSEGSAVHEYLKKEFGYLDLRPVHDELSGLMKVSMGEVDAMVVEISRASYYIEKAGILNLRVAGNAGLLYQLRFAVRNDWPILCGILDKGLSAITDQQRRDISQRWIIVGEKSIFASRAFRISLIAGVGVIALTVVGAIVWNRTLRRIVKQRTSQLQQELTNRGKAEEALHQLNRELRAISNCNQVLMKAADEQELLNEICRIICDEAGYRMAWVGYVENDEAKSVRPVAWSGVEEGYLAEADITWADKERGRGPIGTAIRTGKTDCVQDFTSEPKAAPWGENAIQRGYRSCIALPLKDERENTFGALTIYSTEPNAFATKEEMHLLEELTGDLAFGITVLRTRNARKVAERGIALLSFALDNVHEAAFLIDESARFRYVNEESCRALGYTREELLTMGIADVDPDFPPERWTAHWQELATKGAMTFEGRHMAKDGTISPVEINANYFEYDGQSYNLALARDITERKRAENERAMIGQELESINHLQQSLLKPAPLEAKLTSITDGVVKHFRADFCRIWIIAPGDLCSQCVHAEAAEGPHACRHPEKCLHLLASSGRYTHTDGKIHRRVPFGCYKIGKIASGSEHKFLISDVVKDPHVHNHDWAREMGLVSFAGYQLRTPDEESIGVMALFSQHPILPSEDAMLESLSSAVALMVQQIAAEKALRKLNEELDQRVKERTAELEEKNKELNRMNKLFVGRELRMVDLKERIRELEERVA